MVKLPSKVYFLGSCGTSDYVINELSELNLKSFEKHSPPRRHF